MKILILLSLLFSTHSFSQVLPNIFYTDGNSKKDFCSNPSYQSEAFWRHLMSSKINQLTSNRSHTAQNGFVTQSYLEIFRLTPRMNGAKYMGYVYANASHHLGRLIRYNAWPETHPLRDTDRSFVEGRTLRMLSQMANFMLAPKLMGHSLDLYRELSWSLGAASLCGMDYTQNIVANPNLVDAYRADSISDFVRNFVRYEQSYLQRVMYAQIDIKVPTRLHILDEMRYMTFNGEKQTNFAQWCRNTSCATSSYDLENRISYDVWAILSELKITRFQEATMNNRLKNANVKSTADFFTKRAP